VLTETLSHLNDAAVDKRQKHGAPVVVRRVGRRHIGPVALSSGQTWHRDLLSADLCSCLENGVKGVVVPNLLHDGNAVFHAVHSTVNFFPSAL